MQKNVGNTERVARVGLGAFLASLLFWGPRTKWGLAGLIVMLEGVLGWCAVYQLFGVSTRPSRWERVKVKLG